MNSLTDAVVLVTGAARGMGAEHVRGLVAAGARVLATDVLDDEGQALADELGDQVVYTRLDVTDEAQWQRAVALAEESFGPVQHLINNAGIVMFGSIESLSLADWQRTLDINLTGVWLGMHVTVPSINRAGGGSIVNVSSTAGLQGYGNLGAYVASKWGIRGLTKTAALELGRDGIRVNLIHPGPIRTPMIADLSPDIAAAQPIPRVGEPSEVTAMLLFLLADATYSTGHEFVIDGGAVVGQVLDTLEEQ
ncbi:MAG: SDR family oxidoreductase [Acidimicrobiales bacterium]